MPGLNSVGAQGFPLQVATRAEPLRVPRRHVCGVSDRPRCLGLRSRFADHVSLLASIPAAPAVPDLQVAWLLLLCCAAQCSNCLSQVLLPGVTNEFAWRHDATALECSGPLLGNDALSIIGGLCLRSAETGRLGRLGPTHSPSCTPGIPVPSIAVAQGGAVPDRTCPWCGGLGPRRGVSRDSRGRLVGPPAAAGMATRRCGLPRECAAKRAPGDMNLDVPLAPAASRYTGQLPLYQETQVAVDTTLVPHVSSRLFTA